MRWEWKIINKKGKSLSSDVRAFPFGSRKKIHTELSLRSFITRRDNDDSKHNNIKMFWILFFVYLFPFSSAIFSLFCPKHTLFSDCLTFIPSGCAFCSRVNYPKKNISVPILIKSVGIIFKWIVFKLCVKNVDATSHALSRAHQKNK